MKRLYTYLAAAALAAGLSAPGGGSLPIVMTALAAAGTALGASSALADTKRVKFGIRIKDNTWNCGITTEDNWLKLRFDVESCPGCGMKAVGEIHQQNHGGQGSKVTYSIKWGPWRSYEQPTGVAQWTGKVRLSDGPDIWWDAASPGDWTKVCFEGTRTKNCWDTDPWTVWQISCP